MEPYDVRFWLDSSQIARLRALAEEKGEDERELFQFLMVAGSKAVIDKHIEIFERLTERVRTQDGNQAVL